MKGLGAEIKRGQIDRLKVLLGIINDDVGNNSLIPFAALKNVHFARFVVLDDDDQPDDLREVSIRPTLVFASVIDGSLKDYLNELLTSAAGLDKIFSHCEGYPAPEQLTNERRISYLLDRRIKTQAFYVNTIGRTVRQVHEEARLRNSIENFLEKQRSETTEDWTVESIQAAVRDYVRGESSLKWALTPPPKPSLWHRAGETARFVLVICGVIVLLPLLISVLPFWLILLRYHEKKDARQSNLRLSLTDKGSLENTDARAVQNRISAVGHIKPGWFRSITLRVLLSALGFAARHIYKKGDLGTFKPLGLVGVNTIHFAQWIMIDNGRRMLFFSNYDGSLVSYMDDFVNKVAWGLNAVFSNGVFYPKTNWLFFDGAYQEQGFKAFLQKHQISTQVWYAAYNQYTALNLTNNSEIRNGLSADLNEREKSEWLQRL